MRRLNILLVEDGNDLRALYGFLLANLGHQVRAVKNGLEALAEIQVGRPDLIVTDIAMPVLDGLDLIRAVRADTALCDLPIIAVTSFGKNFCVLAKAFGADAAVERPVEEQEFGDLINSVVAA